MTSLSDEHGIREVIALTSTDGAQTDPSIPLLHAVDVRIAEFVREMYYVSGHQGSGVQYRFHNRPGDTERIADLLGDLYATRESRHKISYLRAIIAKSGTDFTFQFPDAHRNCVAIECGNSPIGWEGSQNPQISSCVRTLASYIPALVLDLMADISLANSEAVWSVLRRYIAENGHRALYQQKVDFAVDAHLPSIFGPVQRASGYVSFSALARTGARNADFAHAKRAVQFWDDFILDRLLDYASAGPDLVKEITQRRGIGGQLSPNLLLDEVKRLKAGVYLLIRAGHRPSSMKGRKRLSVRPGTLRVAGIG